MFYSLLLEEIISIEDPSLRSHGYQLLPLATTHKVDDNREFDVEDIFLPILLIVGGGELMTIEDPSLGAHGYQLLPLETTQKVDDNWEFDV